MDKSTKIVVSLTAIPPRFDDLGQTLRSLQSQKRRPDAIEITIPRAYRRFREHDFRLPEVTEGVEVLVTDEDLGPATKVLPCAQRYRGQNVRIIYCDDDRSAPVDWLGSLVAKSLEHPERAIVSAGTDLDRLLGLPEATTRLQPRARRRKKRIDLGYRARRIERIARGWLTGQKLVKPARSLFETDGYVDIAEGLGGVAVSPDFFDEACFDIPPVLWTVDDIWLSGCLERQGIGIWGDSRCKVPTEHRGGQFGALAKSIIDATGRDEANLACVRYMQDTYGVWL